MPRDGCASWGPPRGYGEQGNNVIYFRETGEHKSKNEGDRGTNVILRSREHRKLRFWFRGIRENAEIFQGNKGTSTTPPPWKGLLRDRVISWTASHISLQLSTVSSMCVRLCINSVLVLRQYPIETRKYMKYIGIRRRRKHGIQTLPHQRTGVRA